MASSLQQEFDFGGVLVLAGCWQEGVLLSDCMVVGQVPVLEPMELGRGDGFVGPICGIAGPRACEGPQKLAKLLW